MKRVLVVDDQAIVREPIEAALRRAGYDAFGASDGAAALTMFARQRHDLILLDVAMPTMDGLSFLRALRALPDGRETPVIILTALLDKSPIHECAKLGVKAYLLKSRFSLAQLLDQVRRHLRRDDQAEDRSEAA